MDRTHEEVKSAYLELTAASDVFNDAVLKFKKVFDPDDVSLDGLIESIDETLSEIDDAIEDTYDA